MLIANTMLAVEAAVGASAVALATNLDGTKAPGLAMYQLVANADLWFAQGIADTVFTADATSDTLTTSTPHKLRTGMPITVSNAGGALPSGLSAATTYWAIALTSTTFQLATSLANAQAGTQIDITTNGTGTQNATTTAKAAAGSTLLPAGAVAYVDGAYGAKVSIIEDSAGGTASLSPVARV